MSNWGKAHENNTTGFGQGSANNSIGWGSLYDKSYSGDTILNPSLSPFEEAIVAYSLRDLGLGATQVVRVRRSSDSTEQDFTAKQITDGSLTTFCGAGDGFVSVWYDQKGLHNTSQSTASQQPKIVNAGSLILENGEPSISFSGNVLTVFQNEPAPLIFQDIDNFLTLIMVEKANNIADGGDVWFSGHTATEIRQNRSDGTKVPFNFGYDTSQISFGLTSNYISEDEQKKSDTVSINQRLTMSIINNNKLDVFSNSINVINQSITIATGDRAIENIQSTFSIGSRTRDNGSFASFYEGNIQELLLYKKDKSAERQDIETNINNYYAIY